MIAQRSMAFLSNSSPMARPVRPFIDPESKRRHAAPSESFKWLLFGDALHVCWKCGRRDLKVKDVAEHRRKYPGGKDEFLCASCSRERVDAYVKERRRALGLQATP